jgi:hypothetical protein
MRAQNSGSESGRRQGSAGVMTQHVIHDFSDDGQSVVQHTSSRRSNWYCQKLAAEQHLPGRRDGSSGQVVTPRTVYPCAHHTCRRGHSPPAKLGRKPCLVSSLRLSASVICTMGRAKTTCLISLFDPLWFESHLSLSMAFIFVS